MNIEAPEQRPISAESPRPPFGFALPPGKVVFGLLAIAWLCIFHFVGNSVLGYYTKPSLFGWMVATYENFPDDRIGYLIPFIVAALLWWKRKELAELPKKPSWVGFAITLAGLAFYVVGYLVQQSRIGIAGFYFGIWGLVGLVWGTAVLRATFFPFCLLVFCVPLTSMTEALTFPLRQFATLITVKICHWILGIPVQQAGSGGTMILDPSGRYHYEVAAACSGIRSITAVLGLTTFYAFVFFRRSWKRLVIVAAAVPLAVISNVLRLLSIVIAAEAFGQDAGNYVHESSLISLLPYIVGFAGVILLGKLLKEDSWPDLRELAIPVAIAAAVQWAVRELALRTLPADSMHVAFFFAAVVAIGILCFVGAKWRLEFSRPILTVGIAALLSIAIAVGYLNERRTTQRMSTPAVKLGPEPVFMVEASGTNLVQVASQSIHFPATVLNYRSQSYPLQQSVYDWLPKDTTYGQRIYEAPDRFMIQVMGLLMGTDRSAIHKPQHCLRGQGWTIKSQDLETIRIGGAAGYDLPVMKIKFRTQVQDQQGKIHDRGGVFVYWFVSEHNVNADDSQRMWQFAWNMLTTGVIERWASIMHVAYTPPDLEDVAYDRIKEFIQASVPEYHLPRTASGTAATQHAAR